MRKYFAGILLAVLIASSFYYFFYFGEEEQGFELDSVFYKTVLKENGEFNGSIRVNNLQEVPIMVDVSLVNLENLVTLQNQKIEIPANEFSNLAFSMKNQNLSKGIYTGAIIFNSAGVEKVLPILLEVESDSVFFDSNIEIFPKTKIYSSDKISAEIKIFDLKSRGASNIKSFYFIQDCKGGYLFKEEDSIVVKDNIAITKTFDSEKLVPGNYIFGVVLEYNNSVSTSSSIFSVNRKDVAENIFNNNLSVIVIVFGFIVLLFLAFVFYSIYSKDKLLSELRCDYKNQKINYKKELDKREKDNEKKLKTEEEKRANKKIFASIKKKVFGSLKKEHAERTKIIKKFKKQKKGKMIQSQINKWKKQGYNTSIFDYNVPDSRDIREQVRKWKKKGFDVSVLTSTERYKNKKN